ncbi:MAG: hypothetical protein ACFCU1_11085 [Sumerlaeia bacterium]
MSKKAAKAPKIDSSKEIQKQLDQIDKEIEENNAKATEKKKQLLKDAVDAKKEEIKAAKLELKEVAKKISTLEKDLYNIQIESGEKRPKTRRTRTASGAPRKPRVSVVTKKAEVEKELGKHSKGLTYRDLKEALLKIIDPASGFPFFTAPDFASSKVFAKKYLPKGWKIAGERRNAEVVPSK